MLGTAGVIITKVFSTKKIELNQYYHQSELQYYLSSALVKAVEVLS
jgi:hypothetical protein